MQFTVQRRLAAQVMKCSPKRVHFDSEALSEIKEAITKADIRSLVKRRAIIEIPARSPSRFDARKTQSQKRKGRRRGLGSRKGKSTARSSPKDVWMAKVRLQRKFANELRDKSIIDRSGFRELYLKIKGGFFRNKRHIKLYIDEHGMVRK